ncbi:MAG: hypothetical protein FWD39_03615 [Clostridiales bacterium]|nr:hypothetical protein [Clostridiales bacterium]
MFPLIHFHLNKQLCAPTPFLALGGLFPDLGSFCGLERQRSHYMGRDFFSWCKTHALHALDLAKGVFYHGSTPGCVDYYADECWPGGEKGWCFQKGLPFMPQVVQATCLPPEFVWWKSHNFVEMALELVINERRPRLRPELLALAEDKAAQGEAAALLSLYAGLDEAVLRGALGRIKEIFTIERVDPPAFAQSQARAFARRFGIHGASVPRMAALIEEIARSIEPECDGLLLAIQQNMRSVACLDIV